MDGKGRLIDVSVFYIGREIILGAVRGFLLKKKPYFIIYIVDCRY
jgi:hypothetical protein